MKSTLKKVIFLAFVCFLSTKVFAQQNIGLTGKLVHAKSGEPIGYAAALLSELTDSTKRTGALTTVEGEFSFKNLKAGSYQLKLSALGYVTITQQVTIKENSIDLGALKMEEDAISLKEVNVKGQQASVKVKKDTVEFNADAFKTKPNAAVEDLLKKLPGVEIDRDGNILVQGQKVTRLTVDGKDFFGTDPKTATKNLPADAIAKVQLIDSKTLEAKATGIDDGQREKVLNLTIKEDKKKGWFGNATVAGGTTDKYNSYLSANSFDKNMQFAALGMSNNINNASFAFDDLNSFSGGNIGNIFAPPAGGSFSINVNNGRTTIGGSGVFDNSAFGAVQTHSGGVNYSNTWGKKSTLALSSSYFTYFSKGNGTRFSNIQDLSNSDILRTDEMNNRISDNQAHRLNLKAEYHPDSLTDIILRPNVILSYSNNQNRRNFSSAFDANGKSNDGSQLLVQDNFTPSLFGEFSVLRRLPNNKGSVSLRLNGTQNTFNSDWINQSLINQYQRDTTEKTDQQTAQENTAKTYTANVNYVRPLFRKKWNGSVGYSYNRGFIDATQLTYDYNPTTGNYETVVPDYSNVLETENWLQAARFGLIYSRTEWTYNFGFALQETGLEASNYSANGSNIGSINRKYYNVLPRLNINFKNKNNQTIQLNYNANVNLPSVNDLQPVQNNSNPLYQRMGNTALDATKNHRISINFNTFSPDNSKYWNGYFLYNLAFDDIGTNVKNIDGVQYVKPINVNGNYYLRTGSFFGKPTKIKGMRMGYGINFFVSKTNGIVSDEENTTYRYNLGPNANFSYDVEGKINASVYISTGYSKVNNSLPLALDNKYFSFNNSANLSYELFKDFRIDAQLDHIGTAGRSDGFNNNVFLLNAGFEKYLMNRRLTLALKGFDILKQNVNIERSVTSSRIEDIRYNNITRYFYLSLNYKIAKAGATNQRSNPRNTVN